MNRKCNFSLVAQGIVMISLTLLSMSSIAAGEPQTQTSISLSAPSVRVVASIRPLGLLAQAIVGDRGEVKTLLNGSNSAHHYALTIAERQQLATADVVLWVGRELESFLEKPIQQRASQHGVTIAAAQLGHMIWPAVTAEGHQSHTEHHHGHEHEHHHDHDGDDSHQYRDPHLWLNPLNNVVIIDELVSQLAGLAPQNTAYYENNAQRLKQSLLELDRKLVDLLSPVKDKGFIVAHPAYHHFVSRYDLQQIDYIALVPERHAGAKHLYELRQYQSVHCVFNDFGMDDKASANQLAEALNVPLVILDPLDASLDSDGIEQLILQIGVDMRHCLASQTP